MSRHDWFRNETWNDTIKSQFMAKLKRARHKDQYLRIQANYLAESMPEVALDLLNQYFELNNPFNRAQAYCDRASAYIALGKLEEALDAYKSALEEESVVTNILTEAYIALPMLVAQNKMVKYVAEANEILDKHKDRPVWPVEHFQWHAAKSIFESELGNKEKASVQADLALNAAKIKKSGFRYHQNLGLVGKEHKNIVDRLKEIQAEKG